VITVNVPDMSSRQSVRTVSARVCDVPGVQTVEADVRSRTVRITGAADPAAVVAAISAAGFSVEGIDTVLPTTPPQSGDLSWTRSRPV
jgi:copper chaperone CopZ